MLAEHAEDRSFVTSRANAFLALKVMNDHKNNHLGFTPWSNKPLPVVSIWTISCGLGAAMVKAKDAP